MPFVFMEENLFNDFYIIDVRFGKRKREKERENGNNGARLKDFSQ